MKKYIAIVTLLLLTPLKAFAFADLEYGMWSQTGSASGNISATPFGPISSSTSQGMLAADLNLPIPLIPNAMFKSTAIYATDGTDTINAQDIDVIAYWQLPLPVIKVRFGGGLTGFPTTVSGSLSGSLPGASLVGYVGLRAKFGKIGIGYDMTQSLVPNVTANSTDMFVSYKFFGPFGAKLGSRTTNLGFDDGSGNNFTATGDGYYASVFMHI